LNWLQRIVILNSLRITFSISRSQKYKIKKVCDIIIFIDILSIDLYTEYEQNTEVYKYLTYIYIWITVLDPQLVGNCFAFEVAQIQQINAKFRQFMDILVEIYIDNNFLFQPPFRQKFSSYRKFTFF